MEKKNYTVIFQAVQTNACATFTNVATYSAKHAEDEARLLLSGALDWICIGIDVE